jgi:hypothetical protein
VFDDTAGSIRPNVPSVYSTRGLDGAQACGEFIAVPASEPVKRLLSALTCRYSGDQRMRRIAPIRSLPSLYAHGVEPGRSPVTKVRQSHEIASLPAIS